MPATDPDRLFVNDMNGRIYVIKDEKVLPEPFLDMAVARKGAFVSEDEPEQGLSGFAFHPDFAKPGKTRLRQALHVEHRITRLGEARLSHARSGGPRVSP